MIFISRIDDRQILHHHILPMMKNYLPMLDVGVRDYTAIHRAIIKEQYTSVDIDPLQKPDIVADITDSNFVNISGCYNSVLFNGVVEFGVNNKRQIELSVENFFNVLEFGGILIIGWNEWNFKRRNLSRIIEKIGFHRSLLFKRDVYEPYYSDNKHCYSMWRKT